MPRLTVPRYKCEQWWADLSHKGTVSPRTSSKITGQACSSGMSMSLLMPGAREPAYHVKRHITSESLMLFHPMG
jgi:hypothetical protein